jgi:extradiol dioxygenase family protein
MAASKAFYGTLLGLPTGRDSPEKWQDYCLFGHQIVCHFVGDKYRGADYYNPVDGDEVPVPHFGAVLQSVEQFNSVAEKLKAGGVRFIIEPTLRFKDTPGEQWTMFVKDPSGNNLEFKYVTRPELLFAKFK